jgi:RNA-directed DNA polymerase
MLVNGTREQAETLRAEAAALLARHGLRLSEAKTLITHVDHGFTFLGFRIQRRTRAGKTPCAYSFMSRSMLAATKRKVKALTRRHTLNLSLSELLMAITPSCGAWRTTSGTPRSNRHCTTSPTTLGGE